MLPSIVEMLPSFVEMLLSSVEMLLPRRCCSLPPPSLSRRGRRRGEVVEMLLSSVEMLLSRLPLRDSEGGGRQALDKTTDGVECVALCCSVCCSVS